MTTTDGPGHPAAPAPAPRRRRRPGRTGLRGAAVVVAVLAIALPVAVNQSGGSGSSATGLTADATADAPADAPGGGTAAMDSGSTGVGDDAASGGPDTPVDPLDPAASPADPAAGSAPGLGGAEAPSGAPSPDPARGGDVPLVEGPASLSEPSGGIPDLGSLPSAPPLQPALAAPSPRPRLDAPSFGDSAPLPPQRGPVGRAVEPPAPADVPDADIPDADVPAADVPTDGAPVAAPPAGGFPADGGDVPAAPAADPAQDTSPTTAAPAPGPVALDDRAAERQQPGESLPAPARSVPAGSGDGTTSTGAADDPPATPIPGTPTAAVTPAAADGGTAPTAAPVSSSVAAATATPPRTTAPSRTAPSRTAPPRTTPATTAPVRTAPPRTPAPPAARPAPPAQPAPAVQTPAPAAQPVPAVTDVRPGTLQQVPADVTGTPVQVVGRHLDRVRTWIVAGGSVRPVSATAELVVLVVPPGRATGTVGWRGEGGGSGTHPLDLASVAPAAVAWQRVVWGRDCATPALTGLSWVSGSVAPGTEVLDSAGAMGARRLRDGSVVVTTGERTSGRMVLRRDGWVTLVPPNPGTVDVTALAALPAVAGADCPMTGTTSTIGLVRTGAAGDLSGVYVPGAARTPLRYSQVSAETIIVLLPRGADAGTREVRLARASNGNSWTRPLEVVRPGSGASALLAGEIAARS